MQPDYTQTQLQGITNLMVSAAIKDGLVEGAFETCTYVERLRRLLLTLNAGRLALRESSVQKSPFSDLVGRLNVIHSFRFAILPPDEQGTSLLNPARHKLLLNVTFDGGWEPYIRVIWRDLGSLLDAICCNCEQYPLAWSSPFDEYVRWVRDHEISGGFFYTNSDTSVIDQRYQALQEQMQRRRRDRDAAERKAAGFALDAPDKALQDAIEASGKNRSAALKVGLRALHAFYRQAPLYPGDEADILLRFTQDLLTEFHELVREDASGVPAEFSEPLSWFRTKAGSRVVPPERLTDSYDDLLPKIQAGIVKPYEDITHGCLVLLRVEKVSDAIAFLESWPVSSGRDLPYKGIYRNVALTCQGLRVLGVPSERLAMFPREFIEGMEARAGILGDLRTNHPDQWRRPVELSTVHVVVQLRTKDDSDSEELLSTFEDEIKRIEQGGLKVLAVQRMRHYPETRGHFGFVDGISQPSIAPSARSATRDHVKRGEILLGYGNDRGDGPWPADPDLLLDNGSFLVVRKLRQHVDVLHGVLAAEASKLALDSQGPRLSVAELKARMMGRRADGESLVTNRTDNDFTYREDQTGEQCPFQSHVRRTNPRDRKPMPRIVRRGMSYGPRVDGSGYETADRGVIFMAYNASIAEQFEVIQRWVAGGNSSGVSSDQSDPFMGVPEAGDSRIFRFLHDGKVMRIDLGDKPFVQLEWGMYLFVPSIDALRKLRSVVTLLHPVSRTMAARPPVLPTDARTWKNQLEDKDQRQTGWQAVRGQESGVLVTDYGALVGSKDRVLEVFRDNGRKYSVCGYAQRLNDSIGNGYLGQDPHEAGRGHAAEVNAAIARISEADAFNEARQRASTILTGFLEAQERLTNKREGTLEISTFSDAVLAQLCNHWFGLPDEKYMEAGGRSTQPTPLPRCPGHFYSVARFVFSPDPSETVQNLGKVHGVQLLEAARRFVAAGLPGVRAQSLSAAIRDAVRAHGGDDDLVARTIVGVMQGFPPTVDGNLRTALGVWLTTRRLWDLQQAVMANPRASRSERAMQVLRKPLLDAMRERPVPDMLWRKASVEGTLGGVRIPKNRKTVLGIISAMRDGADDLLMFGRSSPEQAATTHGCPAHEMAMGVMLGTICALLEAGTLRPTGSPIAVTLIG